MKLLFEPVTTSCGHTFCRPCFLRAQDHGSRCPMCRTVLHVGRELPVTVTLKSILEKAFPLEYAQRQAEEQADMGAQPEGQPEAPVPLFVMSPLMPGVQLQCSLLLILTGVCSPRQSCKLDDATPTGQCTVFTVICQATHGYLLRECMTRLLVISICMATMSRSCCWPPHATLPRCFHKSVGCCAMHCPAGGKAG